jgi:CBS-domain-containing membrane protein
MTDRENFAATGEARLTTKGTPGESTSRYERAMERYLATVAETPQHESQPKHTYYNRTTTVREIMTSGVVAAHEQATFKEIVHSLARNRISSVPVIDDDRKVLGVVSESDLLAHVVPHGPSPVAASRRIGAARELRRKAQAGTAAELMTSPAVTIHPDASVADAARLAAKARVRRLPVVDADGMLVGIVSRGDLLKTYLRSDEEIRAQIVEDVISQRMALAPSTMTVTVEEGIVTLGGHLERRLLVQQLVDEAHAVEGVVAVKSGLSYTHDDTVLPMPSHPLY